MISRGDAAKRTIIAAAVLVTVCWSTTALGQSTSVTNPLPPDPLNAGGTIFGERPGPYRVSSFQTVTASATFPVITEFGYWIAVQETQFTFSAYIMGFDAVSHQLKGDVLYRGAATNGTVPRFGAFEYFAWSTGGVRLTPGNVYALILSSGDFANAGDTPSGITTHTDDLYEDGYSCTVNGRNLTIDNTQTGQVICDETKDFSFTATFTADSPQSTVPEPVTLTLLGTGLAGLGAIRRHRRREVEPAAHSRHSDPTD